MIMNATRLSRLFRRPTLALSLTTALLTATAISPAAADDQVNLALVATPSASYVSGDTSVASLNNGNLPENSLERGPGSYGNWPRRGTQWVEYDWSQPISTKCIDVYWWDDHQGVRLPKACRLQYWDGKQFAPVTNPSGLGVARDRFNATTFDEVQTSKLRLEMEGDGEFSTGLLQWRVLDSGKSPDFPPSVVAGVDRVVVLGGKTFLAGTVRTLKPAKTEVAWTKVSGPGEVTFADSHAATTTATFGTAGEYSLKLTVGRRSQCVFHPHGESGESPAHPTARCRLHPALPGGQPIVERPHQGADRQLDSSLHRHDNRTDLTEGQGGIDNFIEAGKALRGEPHGRQRAMSSPMPGSTKLWNPSARVDGGSPR